MIIKPYHKSHLRFYTISSLILVFSVMAIFTFYSSDLSPDYFPTLVTGAFSVVDVAPQEFRNLYPEPQNQEASLEDAINARDDSLRLLQEMQSQNYSTGYAQDVIAEMEKSLANQDYSNVLLLHSLMGYISTKQNEFPDRVMLLQDKISQYQNMGVNVNQSLFLLNEAQGSFALEQYEESFNFLQQADDILESERLEQSRSNALIVFGQNFFRRYWWQTIIVVVVLSLSGYFLFRKIRKKRIANKIQRLKVELQNLTFLIKGLQKLCFVDKKITADNYKLKTKYYEQRIGEIKHTLPVLEAQLRKLNKKRKGKRSQKKSNNFGKEKKSLALGNNDFKNKKTVRGKSGSKTEDSISVTAIKKKKKRKDKTKTSKRLETVEG